MLQRLRSWSYAFASYPYSLMIFFCWLLRLKRNEWRKRDRDTCQLNFYFTGFQLFHGGKCSSRARKIAVCPVDRNQESEEEFLFGSRKPVFSSIRRLPFLSQAPWEIVIFVSISFCVYFIFIFIFLIYCCFLKISHAIPMYTYCIELLSGLIEQ